MKTAMQEAEELFNQYANVIYDRALTVMQYEICKQCALITVDEIIKASPLEPNDTPKWLQPEDWFPDSNISAEKYWQEVKIEIENL